uniref:Secreted protein n=1 Tax=Salix viminalis TaxID=40686 RepID=A0A6N2LW74_SALVM
MSGTLTPRTTALVLALAVCVEIPMVLSGSTGLCAADSASVAMPRKSDSSRQGEDGCVWILGFDPSCWDCLYVFQSFLFSWATDNDVEDRSRCSPFSLDGSYRQGISREEIQTDRQRRFED